MGADDNPALARTEVDAPGALPELPAPGDTVGRFQVDALLGRGGMSVVVSALDPRLGRRVAIKLVGPGGDASAANELRARLMREARAMAQLRHPNVVAIYEVGEHRGHVFLAMELLTGGTLGAEVRRLRAAGLADWRRVVSLFSGAARGLIAAHQAGLVHRDFKPDNVLIDADGRVAVADFGLVGDVGVASREVGPDVPLAEPLTRASIVVGTPAYMAPEQQRAEPIDARADQFAFCVSLYEALYGELPFRGETRNDYLDAVAGGVLRPPPALARVPAWLHAVLTRGLAVRPEDRWPSMEALLAEIGGDPAAERATGHIERAIGIGTVGAFLCLVLGASLVFDIELSYRLHYLTDGGFLLLAGVFGWISRETLGRSAFNRRLFQLAASGGLAVLGMTVGGQLLGLPAEVTAHLHLFLIGSLSLAGAAFERPLLLLAANYYLAFFVIALWPALYVPVSLTAHALLAVIAIGIFWPRGRGGAR
jgi:hypothetical protein